jgi:hypothetical protein
MFFQLLNGFLHGFQHGLAVLMTVSRMVFVLVGHRGRGFLDSKNWAQAGAGGTPNDESP